MEFWQSKDGLIAIKDMEDSHLRNAMATTIRAMQKHYQQGQTVTIFCRSHRAFLAMADNFYSLSSEYFQRGNELRFLPDDYQIAYFEWSLLADAANDEISNLFEFGLALIRADNEMFLTRHGIG